MMSLHSDYDVLLSASYVAMAWQGKKGKNEASKKRKGYEEGVYKIHHDNKTKWIGRDRKSVV